MTGVSIHHEAFRVGVDLHPHTAIPFDDGKALYYLDDGFISANDFDA
jgi:hypothetical protein